MSTEAISGMDWDPMDTAEGIPFDVYARLRREAPISKTSTGAWFIAKQDDLLAATRAPGVDPGSDRAEHAAGTARPAVEPAVDDQPASDAGADRQQHDIVGADCDAVAMLRQGGEVRVVVNRDREPDALGDELAEGKIRKR